MAVVVPQPPLLVPELAAGAAADTEDLRAACDDAARRLAAGASVWVAVGAAAAGRRTASASTAGTFRGFGVDLAVALAPAPETADPDLPLPLLIAGWLRGRADPRVRVRGELVPPELSPSDCSALGVQLAAELADSDEPVGLLVVGDGAATHTERAPGYLDTRATAFDAAAAAALAAADSGGLLGLDPELATALLAVGRAPWQVLAGAVASTGGSWHGELTYSAAPYGVGYHVAVWTRG